MSKIIDDVQVLMINIQDVIEFKLFKQLNSTVNINNVDPTNLANIFCNGNGNLKVNGLCDCDIAYFGNRCNTAGIQYWKGGWAAFQAIFSIIYIILAYMTWLSLIKYVRAEYGSFFKIISRLFKTPKYMVILNLIIICTSKISLILARVIYLTIDPFKQKQIFGRITDLILNNLIFSACVSMFFILLIVWMGLYTAFDIKNPDKEKHKHDLIKPVRINQDRGCLRHYYKCRTAIIIVLLFIYPAQITFSYFRGIRTVNPNNLNYVLAAFLGLIILFIIIFIYYTWTLKLKLSKSYEAPTNKDEPKIFSKKINYMETKNYKKRVKSKEIKAFLKDIEEKSILNQIVKQITNPNEINKNDLEDSDSELDYEEEMLSLDLDILDVENTNAIIDVNTNININNNDAFAFNAANENATFRKAKSTRNSTRKMIQIENGSVHTDNVKICNNPFTGNIVSTGNNNQPYTQIPKHTEINTHPKKKKNSYFIHNKDYVLTEQDMNVLKKVYII